AGPFQSSDRRGECISFQFVAFPLDSLHLGGKRLEESCRGVESLELYVKSPKYFQLRRKFGSVRLRSGRRTGGGGCGHGRARFRGTNRYGLKRDLCFAGTRARF